MNKTSWITLGPSQITQHNFRDFQTPPSGKSYTGEGSASFEKLEKPV